MEKKKTLVLGASENPARTSYLAINRLKNNQIDTITLYLSPQHQKEYYDYIISLHPKRIIFNPGTENDELAELAVKNNIVPREACTLVMLSTGQY